MGNFITIHIEGKDEPEVYTDGEALDLIKEKLDAKYAQVRGFAKRVWDGMSPLDKTP